MKKLSAGILVYRNPVGKKREYLLAHPGGPYNKNKDIGAWSVVKGETEGNDGLLQTAKREFLEETGFECKGEVIPLGHITQKSGKVVHAWALEMDLDLSNGFVSNKVIIEWPPKSGKQIEIPEIDRLEFFPREEAILKINSAQKEFIFRLEALI